MSEREWHYVYQRAQEGPVPESTLRSRLENAELPMDVLVWSEALEDWVAAHEEPTFQNIEVCPRRPEPKSNPAAERARSSSDQGHRNEAPPAQPAAPQPPPAPVFFVYRPAGNKGPYSHEAIVMMFSNGALVGTDLVWREGLANWTPLSVVLGIQAPPPPLPPPLQPQPQPRVRPAPRVPPTQTHTHTPTRTTSSPTPEGIGRLAYVGLSLAISIPFFIIANASSGGAGGTFLICLTLHLFVSGQRLKNAGYNPWMVFLAFLPIANLFVGFACLLAPAGYAHTNKLDSAAKAVLICVVGFLLLILILVIAGSR